MFTKRVFHMPEVTNVVIQVVLTPPMSKVQRKQIFFVSRLTLLVAREMSGGLLRRRLRVVFLPITKWMDGWMKKRRKREGVREGTWISFA